MPSPPRLFLVDGSNQMYRAYHAIRGLTGPDGKSTNAIYGFVTMLRKLLAEHEPAFIAAAFDLAAPTFRSELAADYKANRAPMPPDLAEQIPLVHEACEALGVPILTHDRYEADDVIGTLARRAAADGVAVAIVTGDKDFFQLVDEHVHVFNPRDEGTWYDADGVREKFGVAPSQVVDVLALMGDAIDNVKGVPGIGEKGARDLIATHGTLDALLEAAATVPQKKYREALTANADSARQSRELVRIHTDVPVAYDLEAMRYRGPDRARCYELFSRLSFRSLVTEFAPTAASVERDYRWVEDEAGLSDLVRELRGAGRVACALIADGPSALVATPVAIALCPGPRRARVVRLGHAERVGDEAGENRAGTARPATPAADLFAALDACEPPAPASTVGPGAGAWTLLAPLFADASVAKVGHDLKPLAIALAQRGHQIAGTLVDTLLQGYVLDATHSSHALEDLALEHVGYRAMREEDVRGKGAKQLDFAALDAGTLRDFAGERADLAWQLAEVLSPALAREGLEPVYRELEEPLVPVLADIERAGIRVDPDVLAAMGARVDRELAERTARIHVLAGGEFNIGSPKQLADVLFDRLQLPVTKRTGKTRSASTAVEVLEELALTHELPREILEWRALSKLKGTYIDALPLIMDPVTRRVHTSFNQAVAATGRLSSSDPNLQNIPIRTELGREIRRAFVAEPGCVLVSADYSQIELRVLAHLAQDEALIAAFRHGEDIHDRTAAAVFGHDSGLDRYELRRRAKIINYALLYGKTAFTLARDIGVTQQAAQAFIDAYFAGFPGVRAFIDATLARARETGAVTTLYGRRRLVPEITSRNGQIRAAAERVAVNMPIQGTAADILKRAMIDLHAALKPRASGRDWDARMILTVHDELVLEARREVAGEIAALVKARMEGAAALAVPLTVEVGIGGNWAEAKA
ncbi:MAG: DNA polymerase I [Vicinamibacterales bacterium]|nr:DNA polymerase I [Vicinamibacterales bacterium]